MKHSTMKKISVAFVICMMTVLACSCGKAELPDEYNYNDYSKYIKLGKYKGLTYEKIDSQVSDYEVQTEIDQMVADSSTYEKNKKGVVASDSIINVDYVGKINGKTFDGGSSTDVDIDMSNNNFIPGFADGMIGHKAGETFDIKVNFPDDYGNADLSGKKATFTITVNYIKAYTIPDYNEEWVKKNTDYKSIKDFEKGVKDELVANKQADAIDAQKSELFNKILSSSKLIKYPKKEYQNRYKQMFQSYQGSAESAGLDFETYLTQEMGMTVDEFKEMAEETCKKLVKQELVLHAIAHEEGIKLTDSDYQAYLDKLLADSGLTAEEYEEQYGYGIEVYAEKNNLFTSLLYQQVMDKVYGYSKENK